MKDLRIAVDGRSLRGKLLAPPAMERPAPAILFVHGWGGTQRRDLGKSKKLVRLGYRCLTFNLFGHGRTREHIDTVTRAENLRDVVAAYDVLIGEAAAGPVEVGVVGTSYGGYLAALLTAARSVRWLALRAPALYMDADFDRPKRQLNLDPKLATYRRRRVRPDENRALAAAARFTGDVLVIESEHDTVVPRPVIESYLAAFGQAESVSHRVLHGADHGLADVRCREAYARILLQWFGARARQRAPAVVAAGH